MSGSAIRSVLFVCTANICRSPMAEAVMKRLARRHGTALRVESAATHEYFVGMPPHPTAVTTGRNRGYDLTGIRARRVRKADFRRFDMIVAMDYANAKALRSLEPWTCSKVRLLLDFADDERYAQVPDPYDREHGRYFLALELIEAGCEGLLRHVHASRALVARAAA